MRLVEGTFGAFKGYFSGLGKKVCLKKYSAAFFRMNTSRLQRGGCSYELVKKSFVEPFKEP